jgi:hypothetical protein
MDGYGWAWIICLGATALVIVCGVLLTRRLRPHWLRDLIRLLAAATLLVPAGAGPSEGYLAPAYIVLLFEAVFRGDGDPGAALAALSLGWIAALVLWLGLLGFRRRFGARGPAPADAP